MRTERYLSNRICVKQSDESKYNISPEEEISGNADLFFLKDVINAGGVICYLVQILEMLRY